MAGGQEAAGRGFLGPDAQPRAARAVRQEPARRSAALRAARMRQDVPRPGGRGRDGRAFISVAISDMLDMWLGNPSATCTSCSCRPRGTRRACCSSTSSTRSARSAASCAAAPPRGRSVNQLLTELDSMGADNEGLFVLAATNQPWDVDAALRRPGRFDRMRAGAAAGRARQGVHRGVPPAARPVDGVDLAKLVTATDTSPAPTWRTCARRRRRRRSRFIDAAAWSG